MASEALREVVGYARDMDFDRETLNRAESQLKALEGEAEATWNLALDAAIDAVLKRCCSHMQKLGHCSHQPCDYYQNALGELRALKK